MKKVRCCSKCKESGRYTPLPTGRTCSLCTECFTPYQKARRDAERATNPEEAKRKAKEEKKDWRRKRRELAAHGYTVINRKVVPCWRAEAMQEARL